LDISRNQITVLPRQLTDAPKLKIVRLAGIIFFLERRGVGREWRGGSGKRVGREWGESGKRVGREWEEGRVGREWEESSYFLLGTPAAATMGDLLTGVELQRRLAAQPPPATARSSRLKLLLVGKANVGKTSLFKSLKSTKTKVGISALLMKRDGHTISPTSMLFGGLMPPPPTTQLSTDGIDMEEWTPEGAPVSFNVFDFAGQVHFLSPHSMRAALLYMT
jgi:hypothetical protein